MNPLSGNTNLLHTRLQLYDELLKAARGEIPVDLAIEGGRILNVLTGEILPGDIAVHRGFIVSLFARIPQAIERIDARGRIALPAFIDPHVHIESSMVLPPAYAEVVAAAGTGTVLADPHEIVNVLGVDGFSLMAANTADLPIRLFFDIPTCVPSKRPAESSGADIRAKEIREMAQRGGRKLGELMSYEEIIGGEAVMTEIVKTGWELGLPRDAHFPMISALGGIFNALSPSQKLGVIIGMLGAKIIGPAANALPSTIFTRLLRSQEYRELDAYLVALGLTADHETYGPEIQIKLDHGMRLMLSSHIFLTLPQMMPVLLHTVRKLKYKDAIGLCSDDLWPDDLLSMGGLAGVLRLLVKNGVNPVDAVRFATLNNAQRLAQAGIPEATLLGAIAPGMAADIVLVAEPLKDFKVDLVIHAGKVVAENGKLLTSVPAPQTTPAALDSVRVAPVSAETFRIPVPSGVPRVRILELPKPPALPFPDLVEADISTVNGYLDTRGYTLIAVFNRYGKGEGHTQRAGTGAQRAGTSAQRTGTSAQRAGTSPVIGLIRGYTLKEGAVASTLAHDSHNLIVLGDNPSDMAVAVNSVLEMHGGMVAVRGGQVLASLPFPVGGLMSMRSVSEMASQARDFRSAIAALGLDPKSPILPFAVFSLPAGPGAKVTDRGVWDAKGQMLVPLLV